MGKFIKRILSEEVHPDFDYIDEGTEMFSIHLKEVKTILKVLKRSGIKHLDKHNVGKFVRDFNEYLHMDSVVLTRYLLIAYFNPVSDLIRAVERKDTTQLYLGPFYLCVVEYWEDDIEEETEQVDEDCSRCDGYGYSSEDCEECDSTGNNDCTDCDTNGSFPCDECDSMGEVDGEECGTCEGTGEIECGECDGFGEIGCDECSATGTIETDCGGCDGEGTIGRDIEKFTINSIERFVVTKEPLSTDIYDYRDATEIIDDSDNLVGKAEYQYTHIEEEDDSELRGMVNELIDIHSEDVIVRDEWILTYFL